MRRPPDNFPGLGLKTLAPRLMGGVSLAKLRLSPNEAYVLSRIDGKTSLWEVCLLVPLKHELTLDILRWLRAEGLIEVTGSTEPMPALKRVEATPPPAQQPPPPPAAASPPRSVAPAARSASLPPTARSIPPAARSAPPELTLESVASSSGLVLEEAAPAPAAISQAAEPPPPALSLDEPLQLLDDDPPPAPPLVLVEEPPPVQAEAPSLMATAEPSAAPDPPLLPLVIEMEYEPLRSPAPEVEVIRSARSNAAMTDDTRPRRRPEGGSPSQGTDRSTGRSTTSSFTGPGSGAFRNAPNTGSSGASGAAALSNHQPGPGQRHGPIAFSTVVSFSEADAPPDLPVAQQQRIDELYNQINVIDAFTLLGVTPSDDKKTLQRAYFKLSKEFHPDRYFKRHIGVYGQRVAAIFQAITEARDTLIDEGRRAAYLASGNNSGT